MIIFWLPVLLCLTPNLCFGHAETDSLGIRNPLLHGHAVEIGAKIGDVKRLNLVVNSDSLTVLYIVCDSIRIADASLALVARAGCAITSVVPRKAVTGSEAWGLGAVVRPDDNGAFFSISPRWRARIMGGVPVRFIILTDNSEIAAGVLFMEGKN